MTIKEIAKEAGVSTATVSYVINGSKSVTQDKRQRVLDVISKTGYRPNRAAKSLRTKKTNTIGVLVEDILAFSTAGIINGISEYVEDTGYHILLNDLRMMDSLFNRYDQILNQRDKINNALNFLVHGAEVDAVIYIGMFDRDITGVITDVNKPIVIAYSTSKDAHACCVSYENEHVSAEMARHLIDYGHRNIAVITGLAHTAPAQTRMRGIHRAFREAGLILDNMYVKNGDWERGSGYSCMRELLSQEPANMPTAVLCMNDLMAIGAMDAIREAGLSVPGDVSVAGFDNREVSSYVYPKLTTAEIDLKAIGLATAEMAIQKLGGTGKFANEQSVVIPSKLILRDTVKRL
jgi:LacI family transcriptional regulator